MRHDVLSERGHRRGGAVGEMKLPRRGCHVAPQVSGRALAPEERGRLVREYLYAHRRAQAMVGQLASALSVPKPGVRIVHDPAVPPGYASLDVKSNTVVVPMATARLRDDHLRAVLAHEVAHLRPSREIFWFCGLLRNLIACRLEDHPVLRGTLTAFKFDAHTFRRRAEAFENAFAHPRQWTSLTGALLATGDYRRHGRDRRRGSLGPVPQPTRECGDTCSLTALETASAPSERFWASSSTVSQWQRATLRSTSRH